VLLHKQLVVQKHAEVTYDGGWFDRFGVDPQRLILGCQLLMLALDPTSIVSVLSAFSWT